MGAIVELPGLDTLIGVLRRRGYTVVGPRVRSGAIVYDELESAGRPRRRARATSRTAAATGCASATTARCSPTPWATTRSSASSSRRCCECGARVATADGTLEVEAPRPPPRYAFLGVRSCDLHAVAIQDRVFIGDRHVDADYEARRRDAFFVAVNCARAGGTCFCVSMDTGPRVTAGLRPRADRAARRAAGTGSSSRPAASADARCSPSCPTRAARRRRAAAAAAEQTERTAASMGRSLDTDGHPRPAAATTPSIRAGTRSPTAA